MPPVGMTGLYGDAGGRGRGKGINRECGMASGGSTIVCDLSSSRDNPRNPLNPRNSEGAFVTLAGGRILFVYTRYRGTSWEDHAPAELASRYSDDGGRTWSKRDRIEVKNEGKCNVMSVSLLRLADGRVGLFYLRKDGVDDCRLWMRASGDEGRSWSRPRVCMAQRGYFVVNNDRVIQLKGGRLVVPAADHRTRMGRDGKATYDMRAIATCFLSDDAGATWFEAADWWALPVRNGSGLQEPGVVELKGGRLWMYCRTDTGRQWELFSRDRGETWGEPAASRFRSPTSPLSVKRIGATGDLLAVWNDHSPRWKMRRRPASWGRTPLATAISSNEGRTWRKAKLIERKADHGYCYTAIHPTDDAVLLAYCCGGGKKGVLQDLCIRRATIDWLYA